MGELADSQRMVNVLKQPPQQGQRPCHRIVQFQALELDRLAARKQQQLRGHGGGSLGQRCSSVTDC